MPTDARSYDNMDMENTESTGYEDEIRSSLLALNKRLRGLMDMLGISEGEEDMMEEGTDKEDSFKMKDYLDPETLKELERMS